MVADTGQFDKAMDRSHTTMGKVGKAAGVAGLAIAAGLGAAAKIGFDEMMSGQKVTAQTNAVLESTKGIANVSAKEIDSLAGSLLKKSGVDDEVIKSGANMLLTFTKVRNETGKGNKIFDEATKATLDLSVAMGKDMSSSAVLVGKALNDPIKGIGALSRVGVQLTQGQKDTIKSMVKLGDTAGAQKVILGELTTQFGGSAEAAGKTLGGQVNIAKESFSNLTGELMTAVMPAFTALVSQLSSAVSWMAEHKTATKVIVAALGGLSAVLMAVAVATKVKIAAMAVAKVATLAWAAAQWLLNAALLANPIGLVIIGLVALGVALVVLWKKSETFRDIVTGTWEKIKDVVGSVVGFFTNTVFPKISEFIGKVQGVFSGIGDWLRDNWKSALIILLTGLPGALWVAINSKWGGEFMSKITGAFGDIKTAAVTAVTGIGGAVWGVINNIGSKIAEMIETIKGWGTSVGSKVKQAVVDALVGIGTAAWNVVNNIGDAITGAIETVKGWGSSVGNWIKNAVPAALLGIGAAAWEGINNIGSFLTDKAETIKGWGSGIIGKIVSGVKGAAQDLWNAVTGIFDQLPGFVKKILGISSPSKAFVEIGQALVAGLVKGLEDKAGDLRKAATDMAKEIAGDAWDKLAGIPSGAASAIGGAAGAVGGAIGIGGRGEGTSGAGGVAGYVSGDIAGLASSFMSQLRDMSGGHGLPIYVQSGFRTAAEQAALVAQKGIWSPSNPTGAAPVGTSLHETGRAADITPGRPSWPFAARYGLNFPIAAEPWHVQSFDKGGWLPPRSKTLAINNTGMWEPVGPPGRGGGDIIVNLNGPFYGNARQLVQQIRTELQRNAARN